MLIVCCNPFSTYIQGFLHCLVMQSFQTQMVWICAAVHLELGFDECSSAVLSLLPPSWAAGSHAGAGIWGLPQFPSVGVGAQAREVWCKAQANKLSWTLVDPVQGQCGWTADGKRGGSSSETSQVQLLLKGVWWEAFFCNGEMVTCCVGGETSVARACLTPGQRGQSCWSLGLQDLELARTWL